MTTTNTAASTKKASVNCPSYVCSRVRTILKRAGHSISKTRGVYTAWCNQQVTTEGFVVTRVGCGKSVSISYRFGREADSATGSHYDKPVANAKLADAEAMLIAKGYDFDRSVVEGLYITCDHYDN